jgi:1-acyl-sn-glycerol-3-phosphate acyltransferase
MSHLNEVAKSSNAAGSRGTGSAKQRKEPVARTAGAATLPPFDPPSATRLRRWLTAARLWHRPKYYGLENVDPGRPTLFVGNHTLFGIIDVPHIVSELQRVHGIFPRSLADRAHFAVPVWRELLGAMGCVEGTRDNCAALMRARQHVLVFPGGGREVFKRKGEAYRLIWKERIGFVQMAAAHGYRIVPFASVGADDAFDIALDSEELMRSPLGALLRSTGIAKRYLRGGEALPPLARGLGPTLVPKPVPFLFSFGRPIATVAYRRRTDDVDAMLALRSKVSTSIEAQLAQLLDQRDR